MDMFTRTQQLTSSGLDPIILIGKTAGIPQGPSLAPVNTTQNNLTSSVEPANSVLESDLKFSKTADLTLGFIIVVMSFVALSGNYSYHKKNSFKIPLKFFAETSFLFS
jgi:hypothetical protein